MRRACVVRDSVSWHVMVVSSGEVGCGGASVAAGGVCDVRVVGVVSGCVLALGVAMVVVRVFEGVGGVGGVVWGLVLCCGE